MDGTVNGSGFLQNPLGFQQLIFHGLAAAHFHFFKNGFYALFHLSPNMDSLIAIGSGASITLLGIPVALSFGKLSHVSIIGMGFLDFYDFLGEYIGMTIGALVIVILAGWILKPKFVYDEIEQGGKFNVKAKGFFSFAIKFVAPVLILIVMVTNVISMF